MGHIGGSPGHIFRMNNPHAQGRKRFGRCRIQRVTDRNASIHNKRYGQQKTVGIQIEEERFAWSETPGLHAPRIWQAPNHENMSSRVSLCCSPKERINEAGVNRWSRRPMTYQTKSFEATGGVVNLSKEGFKWH